MIEYIESLAAGQYKILFWFICAIVFIYLPCMFIYLHRRKEKSRIFEHNHKDAVKVYYELDFVGTLEVYSVNGEDPVHFYETVRQGIYLLPGKNKVGVQYHWAERDRFSLTGYKNFNISPQELDVRVKEGNMYVIGYNHKKEEYEFKLLIS